jgi:hypothetical protein
MNFLLPTTTDELRAASRMPIFTRDEADPDWLRYRMEHDALAAAERDAAKRPQGPGRGGFARALRAAIGRA